MELFVSFLPIKQLPNWLVHPLLLPFNWELSPLNSLGAPLFRCIQIRVGAKFLYGYLDIHAAGL